VALDFLTGVAAAIKEKKVRTSHGFRRTIFKFLQYGGAICVGVILGSTAAYNKMEGASSLISFLNDGLIVFIIYIEITSIFENLYRCDNSSKFSTFLILPVLKLLTFQIKNNPIAKQVSQLTENKE
jgi:amino acid permease